MGEGQEGVPLRLARVRQCEGQLEGGGDQGPGLEPLHPGHGAQVLADAGQVDHLAAAHAPGARRPRKREDQVRPHPPVRMGLGAREDLEGQGLEGVAGEDGGGLVEGPVDGGPPPPEVVIVHAGQVVVDQAVGVDAFQGAGDAVEAGGLHVEQFASLEDEEGPEALARPQRSIAHGLGQPRLRPLDRRQQGAEDRVGAGRRSREPAFGIPVHSNRAGSEATAPPAPTTIFSTLSRACSSRASQWALSRAPRS